MVDNHSSEDMTSWFALTHSLPGFFFINNLHDRIVFHNRTVEDYHSDTRTIDKSTNLGATLMEVALRLNPNHNKLAHACVKKIGENNAVVLKERRGILFEQIFPIMGQRTHVITYKKPILDSHGYIIGLCGYSFKTHSIDESDRSPIIELYQQCRQNLINLHLQSEKNHGLNALIAFAKDIEEKI